MGARGDLAAGLAILAVSAPLLFASGGQAAAGSMLSYRINGGEGQALLCRPRGTGPFPAVVHDFSYFTCSLALGMPPRTGVHAWARRSRRLLGRLAASW